MSPWLSVIVPVHDGARYLAATLAAAVAERPDGVEFLLYDSSDDPAPCAAIARSFAADLTLRYAATPEPRAWTIKTNRGVAEAQAPLVAMLHQDDLWLPGHLAAVRTAWAHAPDAVMTIGPSRFIDSTGRDVGGWHLPFGTGVQSGDDLAATLIVQNTIAIPSPVIRREAWLATGGLDEALWYTADWELYLQLARRGPVHVRPAATTAFRLHGSSLTMTGSRDLAAFADQHRRVLARHADAIAPERRARQLRLAGVALAANVGLAAASQGQWRPLVRAAAGVLGLGPRGALRLLRQTRLLDRTVPRLRLSLTGGL